MGRKEKGKLRGRQLEILRPRKNQSDRQTGIVDRGEVWINAEFRRDLPSRLSGKPDHWRSDLADNRGRALWGGAPATNLRLPVAYLRQPFRRLPRPMGGRPIQLGSRAWKDYQTDSPTLPAMGADPARSRIRPIGIIPRGFTPPAAVLHPGHSCARRLILA